MYVMAEHCASKKTSYDKVGVIGGFITPNNMGDDENKWYCSEVCWFIKWCGNLVDKLKSRISPIWSAWQEVKKGEKLISLASEIDEKSNWDG